ncbi:DinB family protein [Streptomyces sp. NPDC127106]|uniref:DinB family protein n=1 Tax=Streptomyces sp. NPDC127106 TaxID=3345360 RepID=UPI003643AB74
MPTFVPAEAHGDELGALLSYLDAQRGALRRAVFGLTEEQAASCPSASGLSLAGLLKHAAEVELTWLRWAQQQPNERQRDAETWGDSFRLVGDETMPEILTFWDGVSAELEKFLREVPALDHTFPLPDMPWLPDDTSVSMRWLLLHLVEEHARHAGHADIIRESLDGKTAFELVTLVQGGTWPPA